MGQHQSKLRRVGQHKSRVQDGKDKSRNNRIEQHKPSQDRMGSTVQERAEWEHKSRAGMIGQHRSKEGRMEHHKSRETRMGQHKLRRGKLVQHNLRG